MALSTGMPKSKYLHNKGDCKQIANGSLIETKYAVQVIIYRNILDDRFSDMFVVFVTK